MVRIELIAPGILPIKKGTQMKDGVSIIRRVDDIGRVLIPKNICQRFGWLPGTSLEILVDEDCVVYRRYRHWSRAADVLKELRDVVTCDEDIGRRDRTEINEMIEKIEKILRKEDE